MAVVAPFDGILLLSLAGLANVPGRRVQIVRNVSADSLARNHVCWFILLMILVMIFEMMTRSYANTTLREHYRRYCHTDSISSNQNTTRPHCTLHTDSSKDTNCILSHTRARCRPTESHVLDESQSKNSKQDRLTFWFRESKIFIIENILLSRNQKFLTIVTEVECRHRSTQRRNSRTSREDSAPMTALQLPRWKRIVAGNAGAALAARAKSFCQTPPREDRRSLFRAPGTSASAMRAVAACLELKAGTFEKSHVYGREGGAFRQTAAGSHGFGVDVSAERSWLRWATSRGITLPRARCKNAGHGREGWENNNNNNNNNNENGKSSSSSRRSPLLAGPKAMTLRLNGWRAASSSTTSSKEPSPSENPQSSSSSTPSAPSSNSHKQVVQREGGGKEHEAAGSEKMLMVDPRSSEASRMDRAIDRMINRMYKGGNVPATARIIQNLAHYLWPENQPWLRARVVTALSLLVLAKVVNIQVPIFFKYVVDALQAATVTPGAAELAAAGAATLPVGVVLFYGLARSVLHPPKLLMHPA